MRSTEHLPAGTSSAWSLRSRHSSRQRSGAVIADVGQNMTLNEKRVFLGDIDYIMEQASAFSNYVALGYKAALASHPFEQTIHNALLESSLSFLRKLNEFFKGDSEASIAVFFEGEHGSYLWSKEDSIFLNERVMHLSLLHAKEGKTDWGTFLNTHLVEARRRYTSFVGRLRSEQPDLFK